jgi:hypothetical protein
VCSFCSRDRVDAARRMYADALANPGETARPVDPFDDD